jgi:hypothetical protein
VRCLEPFPIELAEELDLLYLPQSSNVAPAADGGSAEEEASGALADISGRGLGREELAVSFYRDERIDLSQMIVEQIVLALPMKPLCKPDCGGLCALCGANRNLLSCDCARRTPIRGGPAQDASEIEEILECPIPRDGTRRAGEANAGRTTPSHRSRSRSVRTATSPNIRTVCVPAVGTTRVPRSWKSRKSELPLDP